MAIPAAAPAKIAEPTPGVATVIAELTARWPSQTSTATAVRDHHANHLTWYPPQMPDAVFFASSTADVQSVMQLCAAHRVPIIPYGTGT